MDDKSSLHQKPRDVCVTEDVMDDKGSLHQKPRAVCITEDVESMDLEWIENTPSVTLTALTGKSGPTCSRPSQLHQPLGNPRVKACAVVHACTHVLCWHSVLRVPCEHGFDKRCGAGDFSRITTDTQLLVQSHQRRERWHVGSDGALLATLDAG